MAMEMTRRPAVSARRSLKKRSGREGTIKLRWQNERRNGEGLGRILKNVILLIRSQAQFSDPYTHQLNLLEFSPKNSFFKPNSPSAHDDTEGGACKQSESSSLYLIHQLDPASHGLQDTCLSCSNNRHRHCFSNGNVSSTELIAVCKPDMSRPGETASFRFSHEAPSVVSNGEARDVKPCAPILTWPEPVHKCEEIPCPICKKR